MKKIELTINGKTYEFHFGFGFYEKVMDGENLPDVNIMQVKPIRQMFYAASWASEVKGEKFMTLPQWYDVLDDLEPQEFSEFVGDFTIALFRSMYKKANLDPKQKKEFEKQIADLEKKLKPQKVATAAK